MALEKNAAQQTFVLLKEEKMVGMISYQAEETDCDTLFTLNVFLNNFLTCACRWISSLIE